MRERERERSVRERGKSERGDWVREGEREKKYKKREGERER